LFPEVLPVNPAPQDSLPPGESVPTIPPADQGLVSCPGCTALNLPNSRYCCQCGRSFGEPRLDDEARREVEDLVRRAVDTAAGGPVYVTEGIQFQTRQAQEPISVWPAALASPLFGTPLGPPQATLQDALVLVCDGVLGDLKALLPLLESVAQKPGQLPATFVVVAGGYEGAVLPTLVVNHTRNTLRCAALELTPPREVHPLIAQAIAGVLQTKVVPAQDLERTKASKLPRVKEMVATSAATFVLGLGGGKPPPAAGDRRVADLCRDIHGRPGVRLELGGKTQSDIRARVRHANQFLAALAPGSSMAAAPRAPA
jgi:hypothetical protein